jgi:cell division protease FtsH
MNNMFKSVGIWLVVALVLMTVFNQFSQKQQQTAQAQLDYSQFLEEVKQGQIAKVTIDGKKITSYAPSDLWMVSDLLKNGVKIEAKPEEEQSFWMSIFVSWFPMLLLIGVWVFFMRQMQGGGKSGGPFSFGKSKARLMDDTKERVTFADVAGTGRTYSARRFNGR